MMESAVDVMMSEVGGKMCSALWRFKNKIKLKHC